MSNTSDIQKSCGQLPQGQIPDGWEIRQLRKVCEFLDSYRIPLKDADRVKIRGEYPYYGASGIIDYINDFIFDEDLILLAEDGANIVNRSTPLAFLINGKVWVNNHAHVLRVHKDISRYYVCAYLESLNYEKYNTGTAQPKLNREVCESIPVLLPPEIEQKKIAEVLSTWDKAIELQTAIIDKLTLRKKGLMQQLLTGKKRFKSFSEPFCYIKAGEVFRSSSIKGAGTEELLSATQENGVVPRRLLEGRVTMPAGNTDNFKLVEKGDFVISLRSFQGGIEYSEYQGIVSPAYIVLKPKLHIDDSFYKYYFKSSDFIGHLAIAVIGIRDGRQISYDDFCFVKIPFPSLGEQCAISEILVLNDREIEKEKQKLEALKQQKKGLMQQLLTGKKRIKTK